MDKKEAYEKLLGKAFFYLRIRQRTEHEMKTYLAKKASSIIGAGEDVIYAVMGRLKELNYLNDATFAESHIRSRMRSKPKGEYVLKQELKAKGVSEQDIEGFFDKNEIDEVALAKQALQKKWSSYKSLEFLKRKKRASDFLLRRGFSYDSIKEALEWAESKNDTER